MGNVVATRFASGVEILRHEGSVPGADMSAADRHRVLLHLSRATQTTCRHTGLRAVRTRGDVDVVPAHHPQGFVPAGQFSSLEVRIPRGTIECVAQSLGFPPEDAQIGEFHMLRDPRLQDSLFALEADLRSAAPYGELFQEGIVLSVAAALVLRGRAHVAGRSDLPAATFQSVIDHIEAHLEGPLSLAGLARVAGMSASSLQRSFRSRTGMSVHQYVVSRRVERARSLLVRAAAPVSEIALMAGFSHQSHMARWMRRLLGVSPRALMGSADE